VLSPAVPSITFFSAIEEKNYPVFIDNFQEHIDIVKNISVLSLKNIVYGFG